MASKTRAALKVLFSSGKMPSGNDFADLIDSAYNKTDDDLTVSGLEPYDVSKTYNLGATFTYEGYIYSSTKDGVTGAFNADTVQKLISSYLFYQLPIWDNAVTYAAGAIVTREAKAYLSASAGNTGNDPLTDAINWNVVTLNNADFGNQWSAGVYFGGQVVSYPGNNKLYKLGGSTYYYSDDLDNEIDGGDWTEFSVGKYSLSTPLVAALSVVGASLGDEMVLSGDHKTEIEALGKVYVTGSTANDGERLVDYVVFNGADSETRIIFTAALVDATDDGNVNIGFNDNTITDVEVAEQKFTVSGNYASVLSASQVITISGSTGNDGIYTIDTATDVGGNTEIVVNETVSDATIDGTLTYFNSTIPVVTASKAGGFIELNGTLATTNGLIAGDTVVVSGSTGNNGNQTVDEIIELATSTLIKSSGIVDNTVDGTVNYPLEINLPHNLHNSYPLFGIYNTTGVYSLSGSLLVTAVDNRNLKVKTSYTPSLVLGDYELIITG